MNDLIYGRLRWNWLKEDLLTTTGLFIVDVAKTEVPPKLLKPEEPAYQDRHALLPPQGSGPHGMGQRRQNNHKSPNPVGKGPQPRRQTGSNKEIGKSGHLKNHPLNKGRSTRDANSPNSNVLSLSKDLKYSSQCATSKLEKRAVLEPWENRAT